MQSGAVEEEEGTPLWKRALMKKRAAEQKKQDEEMQKKVHTLPCISFVCHVCI